MNPGVLARTDGRRLSWTVRHEWVLTGQHGAVSFLAFRLTRRDLVAEARRWPVLYVFDGGGHPWFGLDVGVHSLEPVEGFTETGRCKFLGGRPCHFDGSTMLAELWLQGVLWAEPEERWDVVWALMYGRYESEFGEAPSLVFSTGGKVSRGGQHPGGGRADG